jgi:hypothetical protein
MKHRCLFLLLLSLQTVWANPLAVDPLANQMLVMTSEKLLVMLHPTHAELEGEFTFAPLPAKPEDSPARPDMRLELEIPVWIPNAAATTDRSIRDVAALFPQQYTKVAGNKALQRIDRVLNFRGAYGTNTLKQPWFVGRESSRPNGFWINSAQPGEVLCLLQTYQIRSLRKFCAAPLKLKYRQPLAGTNGTGLMYYEPILRSWSETANSKSKSTHQITFVAATNCIADIVSGRRTNHIASGKQYVLTPRDGEGIVALVRGAKAK